MKILQWIKSISFNRNWYESFKSKLNDRLALAGSTDQPSPQPPPEGRIGRMTHYFKKKSKNPASFLLQLISIFFITFILWSSFFHIDESVKGSGSIIPSKYVQIIDNLEGGIVKGILVQEGEIIKKGQPIIELDTTQTKAKLSEIKRDYHQYKLTIERLHAQINETPFMPSEETKKELPQFVHQELGMYDAAMEQFKKDCAIAEAEINAKKYALKEKEEKIILLKKQLVLAQQQADIIRKLYEKGLNSKLKHLNAERDVLNLKDEESGTQEQIPRLKAEMDQSIEKLKKVKTDFENKSRKELQEAQIKLSELESNKTIYADRLQRQDIVSPVDGIVKEIAIKTLGGVIQAGQTIMSVVPFGDRLISEIKIAPKDIGFVKENSPVTLKIGAYDFTIYGSLQGIVSYVSADTIQEKTEGGPDKTYFKIKVTSDHNYIEWNDQKLPLTPGMPVDADIHIGRRTVMSYILKPILKTFSSAMTER
jgi:adhesin transport system membrane fusion protein